VNCATSAAQREPEAAEGDDPVEPPDVVVVVQAVAGLRAPRRREQADLVVVVERANRQPGGRRDLADAPHGARLGPHPT
jgi:monoamine oxidase